MTEEQSKSGSGLKFRLLAFDGYLFFVRQMPILTDDTGSKIPLSICSLS
jgi:hypothetical protein